MQSSLARHVWQRANGLCEYCQIHQTLDDAPFQIDHVIAKKHGGQTLASNLALSCLFCNTFKGSDISSLEPRTRKLVPLYNPRRHKWERHFRWQGAYLAGRTPIGRATIALLRINDEYRVILREALIAERLFPPT